MKLLFAARFRDLDLLISDQVTADSQLLIHRSIRDRIPLIAPFLAYDKDPYLVIDGGGRLVYVQDAYTLSDRFPHAEPFDPRGFEATGLGNDPFNYIRNSVKITMDAYDGTMTFYIADPSDPIIRAWSGIFPSMFKPIDSLPADLVPHLRVPEELFNVQTRVFGRYHVTNPLRFFQSDDLWTVPQAQGSTQSLPSEAYYVVMRMPGEPEAEFLLLQPMVPLNRPNMIAWVAARMDQPNYGATRVYRFPAETSIFGPAQIEARIVQDPLISQQFTLWSQGGSTVIQGNLIVVPVDDSLIYLQPVYLQSQQSAFPEFQRIIVASPRQVVWAETLGEALDLLLVAEGGPSPGPTPTPAPTPTPSATPRPTTSPGPDGLPSDVPGLVAYANEHFELAQAALRDGDFALYGEEIAKVEAALAAARRARPWSGLPGSVSVGATLTASLLAVLDRPSTWPLALVGFLLRGGWLLVIAPIIVLPTAVGLANIVAPLLEDVAFGRPTDELIRTVVLALVVVVGWIVVGGLVAAVAEGEAVRRIATESDVDLAGPPATAGRSNRAWRILAVRIAAHIPFLIAFIWGSTRIVAVAYRELTVPSDVTVPSAWRIVTGAPEAIVVIALTWLIGEAIGAMGARRVILAGEGARQALRAATGRFGRAPLRPLALAFVSTAVLGAVVLLTGLAAGSTWDALRSALQVDESPALTTALLFVFIALFSGGLVLLALTAAWRVAIWTLEAGRSMDGTFGGGSDTRSGDKNAMRRLAP